MDALLTIASLAGLLAVFGVLAAAAGADSRDGFDRIGPRHDLDHDAAGRGPLFR